MLYAFICRRENLEQRFALLYSFCYCVTYPR